MIAAGYRLAGWLKSAARRKAARARMARFPGPLRLHIGCGKNHFPSWVHLDMNDALLHLDVLWHADDALPCEDGTVELIYSEHFLEHLPVEVGVRYLKECYRVLRPGGVLRTAMPSLDVLLDKCCSGDWRDQDWLTWPEYRFIQTRAEMLNIAFRWWDHQWLYDREELGRRLREAGFTEIADTAWGESSHPELCRRETRKDSILICEARK
jgi:predicted SAM-dependent methyltransferase